MIPKYVSKNGYTLVEMLVVLSIMGILFGAGYANYRGFSQRQILANTTKTIQADLRLAQSTALSAQVPADASCTTTGNLNGYNFTILSATHYEIRANCSGPVAVATPKKDVVLTNGVTITTTVPLSTILFKVLGSGTNIVSGNVTINLLQVSTGNTGTVTVSSAGANTMINEKGQSLFELVMALGVISVIIVVLVSLVNNAVQNAAFSKNQTLATRYAETATEWLRTQRDVNISTFITKAIAATPSYCLVDDPLVDTSWLNRVCGATDYIVTGGVATIFKRQVTFPAPTVVSGKNMYIPSITVTWIDSKGTHTINNSTQFTDWRQR